LLVGLALLIFYTLLLSLSEYIAFGYAYLIASGAIVILITTYSTSFLDSKLRPAVVAIVLAILYGYLYIVLQLQDYALLMGSLVLFIALALTMYLTRKLDWFSVLNYRKMEDRSSGE
jgi:inner membrane protein